MCCRKVPNTTAGSALNNIHACVRHAPPGWLASRPADGVPCVLRGGHRRPRPCGATAERAVPLQRQGMATQRRRRRLTSPLTALCLLHTRHIATRRVKRRSCVHGVSPSRALTTFCPDCRAPPTCRRGGAVSGLLVYHGTTFCPSPTCPISWHHSLFATAFFPLLYSSVLITLVGTVLA
jgi:hypothetical protein